MQAQQRIFGKLVKVSTDTPINLLEQVARIGEIANRKAMQSAQKRVDAAKDAARLHQRKVTTKRRKAGAA